MKIPLIIQFLPFLLLVVSNVPASFQSPISPNPDNECSLSESPSPAISKRSLSSSSSPNYYANAVPTIPRINMTQALNSTAFRPLSLESVSRQNLDAQLGRIGGLNVWIAIAKDARNTMRKNETFTMEKLQSYAASDGVGKAISNWLNLVVFLAFNLLAAFLMLLCAPCICIFGICRRRRKFDYTVAPSTKQQRMTLGFLAVVFIFELVAVICALQGNTTASSGLMNAFGSVGTGIEAFQAFSDNVKPSVSQVFVQVQTTANSSIDKVTDTTGLTSFINGMIGQVNTLSTDLGDLDQILIDVMTNSVYLETNLTAATGNITILTNDLQTISTNASDLNNVQTVESLTYQLITSISGIPDFSGVVITNFSSLPNITDATAPLRNVPNLKTKADDAQTEVTNMNNSLGTTITDARESLKSKVKDLLGTANVQISAQIESSPFSAQMDQSLNDARQAYVTVGKSFLTPIDDGRYYTTLSIGLVVVLIMVTVGVATAAKAPKGLKCGACTAIPISSFLFLFCIVHLLFALVVNEVCQELDSNAPFRQTAAITKNQMLPALGAVGFQTLENCNKNYTLLEAVGRVDISQFRNVWTPQQVDDIQKLLNTVANFSLARQASDAFDQINWNQTINDVFNLDVNSLFNLGNTSIQDQLSPFNSSQFTSFNYSQYTNETDSTAINTTSLTNFRGVLDNIMNSVDDTAFNYGGAYNNAEKLTCVNDFKAKIQTILDLIDLTTNTTAVNIENSRIAMLNVTQTLESTVNLIPGKVASIVTKANNIIAAVGQFIVDTKNDIVTNRIPSIRTELVVGATSVQNTVTQALSCQPLASSILYARDSTCQVFLGGIDALWLACFVGGFVTVVAIIAITMVNRRIEESANAQFDKSINKPKDPQQTSLLPIPVPSGNIQATARASAVMSSPSGQGPRMSRPPSFVATPLAVTTGTPPKGRSRSNTANGGQAPFSPDEIENLMQSDFGRQRLSIAGRELLSPISPQSQVTQGNRSRSTSVNSAMRPPAIYENSATSTPPTRSVFPED